METLKSNYKKDKFLHHAYFLEGERGFVLPALKKFFEQELGLKTKGNPDVIFLEYDTFGIDDGRFLKSFESQKSAGGGRKICVIVSNFFTHEAQNAVLKIFEDPRPDTHFFIISSNTETFLPTLMSRMHQISVGKDGVGDKKITSFAIEFLAMRPGARLENAYIKELIEEKDKQKTTLFVDTIAKILHKRFNNELAIHAELFGEIIKARSYLADRSASVKLILEYLSLILPQTKIRFR